MEETQHGVVESGTSTGIHEGPPVGRLLEPTGEESIERDDERFAISLERAIARAQPQTAEVSPSAPDRVGGAKRSATTTASGSTPTGALAPAILFDANDGALRIARTLVKRGVRVHVLARPPFSFVANSRGVEGRTMPTIASEPGSWLSELERLAAGGPAVVLSGSDAATELLCRERARISPNLRMFGPKMVHTSRSWTRRRGRP